MTQGLYIRTPEIIEKYRKSHLGKKLSRENKENISKAIIGDKNPRWAGNKIGYYGLHTWMRKTFGKANKCELNSIHKSWRYEWALIKGKTYERKRENFIMLCLNCHRSYDKQKEVKTD